MFVLGVVIPWKIQEMNVKPNKTLGMLVVVPLATIEDARHDLHI